MLDNMNLVYFIYCKISLKKVSSFYDNYFRRQIIPAGIDLGYGKITGIESPDLFWETLCE